MLKISNVIAHNEPRLCEGAVLKDRTFNFALTLAKPFFVFAKLQKRANTKWFLRMKSTKVEFCT